MIVEITIKMKNGEEFKYNSQAEAIKNARIAAGLSQEQAAEKAGIKVQSWQKYEYGQRTPKDDMLERYNKIYRQNLIIKNEKIDNL